MFRIAYAMRRMLIIVCFVSMFGLASAALPPEPGSTNSISGVVLDARSGTPLPGARVHLVELGWVVITSADGRFAFVNAPAGSFTLGVHLGGFASVHDRLTVPRSEAITVVLQPARFEEETSVIASPFTVDRLDVAQQVDIVPAEEAKSSSTASLGAALQEIPGVTTIPTGAALGTPVIRGLSENRIRVLNDGVPLNHQQFSWRHSPNIEASLSRTTEVVRGPASVLYGPDAMGGVINVIQPPLPAANGNDAVVHGEIAAGWGTNAGELTGRAEAEGAVGAFGWNVGLVRRTSDDIETPDRTLDNTDFEQTNGNVTVGFRGGWGTARMRWNHWELDTGYYRPVGFRLGLEDDLIAGDLYLSTPVGAVEVVFGHQTNARKALPVELGGRPAVDLELVTQTIRAGLHHDPVGFFRGRVAAEYVGLDNDCPAPCSLVPRYLARPCGRSQTRPQGRASRVESRGLRVPHPPQTEQQASTHCAWVC